MSAREKGKSEEDGNMKRRRDNSRTNWKNDIFTGKHPTYEQKIEQLEKTIEELRSHIRLAEEMLARYFRDKKRRPYVIDLILGLMKTDDGVSPWAWNDRSQTYDIAAGNLLDNVNELYEYLQGIGMPTGFRNLKMPNLPQETAWEVIYVLQEHLRIIPDHIERCDSCGGLFDDWREGWKSELEGKIYCGGCLDESEATFCVRCGGEVWKDKAWDEDEGEYLCEDCKEKSKKEDEE
jgi:hypothetical protein